MSKKLPFTPSSLDGLKAGSISDPRTPGLSIEASCGKRTWVYKRRVAGSATIVRLKLGGFPAFTIADAREWAGDLNAKVERGEDPRVGIRSAKALRDMTVEAAWNLYYEDITTGAVKGLSPLTLRHKRYIWSGDIKPKIGNRPIIDVSATDLYGLVKAKAMTAPTRANRLNAELKVFFGWCASRAGEHAGVVLTGRPGADIGWHKAKVNPERARTRILSEEEIGWFFKAVAEEPNRQHRRAFLLLCLTGARLNEILTAPASEYRAGIWYREAERMKSREAHAIPLSAWGQSLMATNDEWLIPAERSGGVGHLPKITVYKVRNRIIARMSELAGHDVAQWTPHDLRRTMRSNTRRLKIDTETAEEMMAHKAGGLIAIYDQYEAIEERRDAFQKWEAYLVGVAFRAGVADELGCAELVETYGAAGAPRFDRLSPEYDAAIAHLEGLGEIGRALRADRVEGSLRDTCVSGELFKSPVVANLSTQSAKLLSLLSALLRGDETVFLGHPAEIESGLARVNLSLSGLVKV